EVEGLSTVDLHVGIAPDPVLLAGVPVLDQDLVVVTGGDPVVLVLEAHVAVGRALGGRRVGRGSDGAAAADGQRRAADQMVVHGLLPLPLAVWAIGGSGAGLRQSGAGPC